MPRNDPRRENVFGKLRPEFFYAGKWYEAQLARLGYELPEQKVPTESSLIERLGIVTL